MKKWYILGIAIVLLSAAALHFNTPGLPWHSVDGLLSSDVHNRTAVSELYEEMRNCTRQAEKSLCLFSDIDTGFGSPVFYADGKYAAIIPSQYAVQIGLVIYSEIDEESMGRLMKAYDSLSAVSQEQQEGSG